MWLAPARPEWLGLSSGSFFLGGPWRPLAVGPRRSPWRAVLGEEFASPNDLQRGVGTKNSIYTMFETFTFEKRNRTLAQCAEKCTGTEFP